MNVEVIPCFMLDQVIVELRCRAGGNECLPIDEVVDVLRELRREYGMTLEQADWFLSYREAKAET